jgi:hypothetical protein
LVCDDTRACRAAGCQDGGDLPDGPIPKSPGLFIDDDDWGAFPDYRGGVADWNAMDMRKGFLGGAWDLPLVVSKLVCRKKNGKG